MNDFDIDQERKRISVLEKIMVEFAIDAKDDSNDIVVSRVAEDALHSLMKALKQIEYERKEKHRILQEHKDTAGGYQRLITDLRAENESLRASVIEECAKEFDRAILLCKVWSAKEAADKIRALVNKTIENNSEKADG